MEEGGGVAAAAHCNTALKNEAGFSSDSPIVQLLSFPSSSLLCPQNIPHLLPGLARAFESVEGFSLVGGGEVEGGGEEYYAKVTSRLQCALLLLAELAGTGREVGLGGRKRKRKGRGGSHEEEEVEGEDSKNCPFFQSLRVEFIAWARQAFGLLGSSEGAGQVFVNEGGGAKYPPPIPPFMQQETYTILFPTLNLEFPELFPASCTTLAHWKWSCRVVMACGVPLQPYGAQDSPLQCCIPLFFPLLPIKKSPAEEEGPAAGACLTPVNSDAVFHRVPLGAKWSVRSMGEGGFNGSLQGKKKWVVCLHMSGCVEGSLIFFNPASPCWVGLGGEAGSGSPAIVPSNSFSLPVPLQLTWLLSPEEEEKEE